MCVTTTKKMCVIRVNWPLCSWNINTALQTRPVHRTRKCIRSFWNWETKNIPHKVKPSRVHSIWRLHLHWRKPNTRIRWIGRRVTIPHVCHATNTVGVPVNTGLSLIPCSSQRKYSLWSLHVFRFYFGNFVVRRFIEYGHANGTAERISYETWHAHKLFISISKVLQWTIVECQSRRRNGFEPTLEPDEQ